MSDRPGIPRSFWIQLSWLLLLFALLAMLTVSGKLPVDMKPYFTVKQRLQQGKPMYPTVAESQKRWSYIHVSASNHGKTGKKAAIKPGPYVYPPSLGLWLKRLGLPPLLYLFLLFSSLFAFAWLWKQQLQPEYWGWGALVVFSWDVVSSLTGGNIELMLLTAGIFACWFLWKGKPWWAIPLIAFTVLCKPFYAFLYAAFCLLWLAQHERWKQALQWTVLAGIGSWVLIGLDVWSWGASLQQQAWTYLSQALEHQWMSLPIAQQSPMSGWNRSLMQGLVLLHIPARTAQILSLAIWAFLLGLAIWRIRNKPQSFSWLLATAMVLFYWGRPVTWGMPLLEILILTALWNELSEKRRVWLKRAAWTLIASHWLAVVAVFVTSYPLLLTLQTASFPWETWLLLPSCLILLLWNRAEPQPRS